MATSHAATAVAMAASEGPRTRRNATDERLKRASDAKCVVLRRAAYSIARKPRPGTAGQGTSRWVRVRRFGLRDGRMRRRVGCAGPLDACIGPAGRSVPRGARGDRSSSRRAGSSSRRAGMWRRPVVVAHPLLRPTGLDVRSDADAMCLALNQRLFLLATYAAKVGYTPILGAHVMFSWSASPPKVSARRYDRTAARRRAVCYSSSQPSCWWRKGKASS